MEGWNTVISDLRKAERKTRLECADCPDLDYCVPCAGRNLLETGSAFETAPVMCERSHARAQAFREKEKRLGEKTQHV